MHFDTQSQLMPSLYLGKHTPSLRLAKGSTFSINKSALSILGSPRHVMFWYSKQRNTLLLAAVDQPTATSFSIPDYCYNTRSNFQIRMKAFTTSVLRCTEWNDTNNYVVYGVRIDQLGAIAFPLNNAMIEEVKENE